MIILLMGKLVWKYDHCHNHSTRNHYAIILFSPCVLLIFHPMQLQIILLREYTLPTHYPLVIIIKRNTFRNNMIMCNWRQTSRTFVIIDVDQAA